MAINFLQETLFPTQYRYYLWDFILVQTKHKFLCSICEYLCVSAVYNAIDDLASSSLQIIDGSFHCFTRMVTF